MRAREPVHAVILAAALLASPTPADAQPASQPRFDLTGTIGWFANDRDFSDVPYLEDANHRWVFGADAGYYWTEHLKTEVGVASTTKGDSYVLVPVEGIPGRTSPFASGRLRVRATRVITQQLYQFGHNAWFHPYVGAGVVVQHETARTTFEQYTYGPGRPRLPDRTNRAVRAKAVLSTGFKAYMSPRSFFRGDLRISPWTKSRDYSLACGIGVDF